MPHTLADVLSWGTETQEGALPHPPAGPNFPPTSLVAAMQGFRGAVRWAAQGT